MLRKIGKYFLLTVFCTVIKSFSVSAQITIKTIDENNSPVSNVNVMFQNMETKKIEHFGFSSIDGMLDFKPTCDTTHICYQLVLTHVSYAKKLDTICCSISQNQQMYVITLKSNLVDLKEINVKPSKLETSDTVFLNTMEYLSMETTKLKDLLGKMPDFEIGEDGSVRYRGKEVQKILIENDDLTGDNYQVLTKAINAHLITQIQVVKNFHENKYLSKLIKSDEIALNLKLSDKMRYSVTGSVGYSESLRARRSLELELLTLTKNYKNLMVVDWNNTGSTFLDNASNTPNASNEKASFALNTKFYNQVPFLSNSYVLDNQFAGAGGFNSLRVGKKTKIRVGLIKELLHIDFYRNNKTTTQIGNRQWSLSSDNNDRNSYNNTLFDLHVDTEYKHLLFQMETNVDLSSISNVSTNMASGAFNDTLESELATNSSPFLHHKMAVTKSFSDNQVLVCSSKFTKSMYNQELDITSNRLTGIEIPNFHQMFEDSLSQLFSSNHSKMIHKALFVNKFKPDASYTLLISSEHENYQNQQRWIGNDPFNIPPTDASDIHRVIGNSNRYLIGGGVYKVWQGNEIWINAKYGVAVGSIETKASNLPFYLTTYDLESTLAKKVKKLNFSIKANAQRHSSYRQPYYSPFLLNSSLTFDAGAQQVTALENQQIKLSISNIGLYQSTQYQLSFTYINETKSLVPIIQMEPNYMLTSWGVGQGTGMSGHAELTQRIKKWQLTPTIQTTFQQNKRQAIINNKTRVNNSNNYYIKWNNNFPLYKKLNGLMGIESQVNTFRQVIKDSTLAPIHSSMHNHKMVFGLRWTLSKWNAVMNMRYLRIFNQEFTNHFHAMNYAFKIQVNKRWSFDLNVHNLLNNTFFTYTNATENSTSVQSIQLVPFYATIGCLFLF